MCHGGVTQLPGAGKFQENFQVVAVDHFWVGKQSSENDRFPCPMMVCKSGVQIARPFRTARR